MGEALTLAYGAEPLRIVPPVGPFTTLGAGPARVLSDPAASLLRALDEPIDSPPLRALVRPGERVTIIVSDGSRATGIRALLPALLSYLESAGVPSARVRILFALGMHRPQTAVEQAAIVGADVADRVAHADHLCDDEHALETLATEGPAGRLRVNRHVLDGSLVIVTGAITFHYLAGFGGGRKAIMPGIAARESVREFHRHSLAREDGAGRHAAVALGVRAGNPLDALATRAASAVPRTFLINTILAPGAGGTSGTRRAIGAGSVSTRGAGAASGIMAIVAGNVATAFDHGCERYRRTFTVPVAERRSVVVVSAGGQPRDRDLVQAHKAIATGTAALTPGGMMLVVAACPEGAGHDELPRWFAYPDRATHLAALRAQFSVPGQTALALREHAEQYRVYLLSTLPPDLVARAGMVPITRPADFFADVVARYGRDVPGYVLPDGARYLPVVGQAP